MEGRLHGKVALVTGAAQGIGAAITYAMIKEGATVVASDIKPDVLANNRPVKAIKLDVSQEESWREAAALIDGEFGRLDILVNNAGIAGFEGIDSFKDLTLSQWRRVMSVNLDGVFLGCNVMQPLLEAGGAHDDYASVVNVSSVAGIVAFPNQAAYNASKAGVRHLSKSLAIEWAMAGLHIRVNSIHPGAIQTPMLEAAVPDWAGKGVIPADDPWAAVAKSCPMNMIGAPEDIAHGAVYLASREARFVTGIELVIDGGWTAM